MYEIVLLMCLYFAERGESSLWNETDEKKVRQHRHRETFMNPHSRVKRRSRLQRKISRIRKYNKLRRFKLFRKWRVWGRDFDEAKFLVRLDREIELIKGGGLRTPRSILKK